ncbi:MAG: glycosyltransferase [Erysipelotrichaceae bacterium]|nr:glycosyltransferase [Erysipelotrichaceae bacterium]
MKVSVIMPVYNAINYLKKAVDSIIFQNFDDFELILIDDGSSDGSEYICDEYSKKYSNVNTIHQKNGGICSARNTGISNAKGEFIMFCDDDDMYFPGFIQTAYQLVTKHHLDLLRFQCVINEEKKKELDWDILTLGFEYEKSKGISYDEYLMKSGPLFVWNAIYRSLVIREHHLQFDEKYQYGLEDFDFNLQFYLKMKRAAVSSKVFYHHFEHIKHSTSSNRSKEVLCYKYRQEPELLMLEYQCVQKFCRRENWRRVFNERKAEVLARFRHQMKESNFSNDEIHRELSQFKASISELPSSFFDFLHVAKGPTKAWVLLLLFELNQYALLIRI